MGLMRGDTRLPAVTLRDVEPAAELLRSLASPQRLPIVCTLIEGERAVSELEAELGIRQPSLSQHLGSLREAGIIVGRREAKAVFYSLSDARVAAIVEALHAIFCEPQRGRHPGKARRPPAEAVASRTGLERTVAPRRGEAAVFALVGSQTERGTISFRKNTT